MIGSLAAYNNFNMYKCWGNINVTANERLGGLIGLAQISGAPWSPFVVNIENCFVTGNIAPIDVTYASARNGGLIGELLNSISGSSGVVINIRNNYVGAIVIGYHSGSFGGFIERSRLFSSYSRRQSDITQAHLFMYNSIGNNIDSLSGLKYDTELQTQNTFSGWDFSDIWAIDAGKNNGMPYLQVFEDLFPKPNLFSTLSNVLMANGTSQPTGITEEPTTLYNYGDLTDEGQWNLYLSKL